MDLDNLDPDRRLLEAVDSADADPNQLDVYECIQLVESEGDRKEPTPARSLSLSIKDLVAQRLKGK